MSQKSAEKNFLKSSKFGFSRVQRPRLARKTYLRVSWSPHERLYRASASGPNFHGQVCANPKIAILAGLDLSTAQPNRAENCAEALLAHINFAPNFSAQTLTFAPRARPLKNAILKVFAFGPFYSQKPGNRLFDPFSVLQS